MRHSKWNHAARWAAIGTLGLIAGCGHKRPPPPAPAPPPAALEPVPPLGAARGLPIPQPGPDGRFETINSAIGAQEAIWHLRAALNVAALSCRDDGSLTRNYNQLLTQRKAMLSTAYGAETGRFKSSGLSALDKHMTQLYNFFAQPPAQPAFCQAAKAEILQAVATAPADFPAYAPSALDRLEAPVIAFYAAYDSYRHDLAAWEANPNKAAATATMAAKVAPAPELSADQPISASWRIQIGAFTGEKAAKAAWEKARTRIPSLASYEPHYEAVPGRPELVRLQVGSASDRAGAIQLCASAAVGGFDCLPVVPAAAK